MARAKKAADEAETKKPAVELVEKDGLLAFTMARPASFRYFNFWIVGETPLITHAWSQKAKNEMLQKHVKAPKAGKEQRDPNADFVNSLYAMPELGPNVYGFPATGVKNAILSAAHKDRGVPRSQVMGALWLDSILTQVRPALAGAVCDMPLIRIHGSEPQNREDMVRIGAGLNKTANLAYRGQFKTWAMRISGKYNSEMLNDAQLGFLVQQAGMAAGLGEWRNERKGTFGAFRMANVEEAPQWEAYAKGEGPLPEVVSTFMDFGG